MSGGNKPYYDRDDLDEDEKKLFDAMVLEEMEKLEKQFDASSLAPPLHERREREVERDHNRDNKPPQLQLNSSGGYRGDARDERSYTRDRPSNEPLGNKNNQRDGPREAWWWLKIIRTLVRVRTMVCPSLLRNLPRIRDSLSRSTQGCSKRVLEYLSRNLPHML